MAKQTKTSKTAPKAPQVDWHNVAATQSELLSDTSLAVFELEMSLKTIGDKFYSMDYDAVGCLISSLARAASSIQDRIDMHLAYLPSTEAADDK
jgi:hypothetical protein